jgi:universal stress protein A
MKTKNRIYSQKFEPAVIMTPDRSAKQRGVKGTTIELAPIKLKIRKILVPIDFSETSKRALNVAIAFAEQFNGKISLIYVTTPHAIPTEEGFVSANLSFVLKTNELLLSKLAEERIPEELLEGTMVKVGKPYSEIVEAARKNIDLIIMTTHGNTGFKHFCIGSTTEKVVQHAPCPVLTVCDKKQRLV